VNYKRKLRCRFSLPMWSRTPPISSEFRGGGVEPPKPPLLGTPLLLVNEETALKDMIDKIIENGRCYGMEIYVEKTKIMKISRQPFPLKIMIDQKKTTECGMF